MVHFQPGRQDFSELSRAASVVPVYCSILSDQLTPVSAFHRLAAGADHAFLLESVVGGEKIARYSFLGARPFARIEATRARTTLVDPSGERIVDDADPLTELEAFLAGYNAPHLSGLPRFLGGAVGYAGYDIVRHYEHLDTPPADDRGIPDLQFGIYDEMVIFDHVNKLINVVAHAHVHDGDDLDAAYDGACARVQAMVDRLTAVQSDPVRPFAPTSPTEVACQSNVSSEQFEQSVERCKEYIRAGDIFQVVLGQRFTALTDVDPFDLYRALRVINPSPFMFYLQTPAVTLVGASPEILCRIEGRTVSTRPLAGTRPRGRTEAEDRGLEAELLADPKERAEHVMLVDLGRNDLGRVCEPGSVKIDDLMSVERYSHVMHICSNVSGTLAPDKTAFDAVRSVLPVGTVSGAPKIRAMQIIDELEPVRRGPYAGAVGYVDFGGNMDTCIALRTLVITPSQKRQNVETSKRQDGEAAKRQDAETSGGRWRVDAQVGAGIVADSEPSNEYQETLNKAQAMLSALNLASSWLDSAGTDPAD